MEVDEEKKSGWVGNKSPDEWHYWIEFVSIDLFLNVHGPARTTSQFDRAL